MPTTSCACPIHTRDTPSLSTTQQDTFTHLPFLMNEKCQCTTLDKEILYTDLQHLANHKTDFIEEVKARTHLFANNAIFIAQNHAQTIIKAVQAWQQLFNHAPYEAYLLEKSLPICQAPLANPSLGVFMGFDFHINTQDDVKLIEINTNAGGALLCTAMQNSHQACCDAPNITLNALYGDFSNANLDFKPFFDMFMSEWKQRKASPLVERDKPSLIAIVDQTPFEQYLAPEFELFVSLFANHGIKTIIADSADLVWDGSFLRCKSGNSVLSDPIDMVYNRLTDFYLEHAQNKPLSQAYQQGAIVLTPSPRAHAIAANKLNLVQLSDPHFLNTWHIEEKTILDIQKVLIPTELVTQASAETLWAKRKHYFFKPSAGYGSKAVYRGDKITKTVWNHILNSPDPYIAQQLITPSKRRTDHDEALKFDIRAYAYNGRVQLLSARVYEGQTTNFRTPNGGFAPVMIVADSLKTLNPLSL